MPPHQPHPHAEALDELVALGMSLARAVTAAALAAETPDPAQVAAFNGLARTVRRTVLLARKLEDEPTPSRARRRTEARARIIRDVEDAIQRHDGPEHPDTLRAELAERLDDPDLDDELESRPIAEIIRDIRCDLGIEHMPGTHPWARRRPADIRHLRRRAARTPHPPDDAPSAGPRHPIPAPPAFVRPNFPYP